MGRHVEVAGGWESGKRCWPPWTVESGVGGEHATERMALESVSSVLSARPGRTAVLGRTRMMRCNRTDQPAR